MNAKLFHKELFILAIIPLVILEIAFRFIGNSLDNPYWQVFQEALNADSGSNVIVLGNSRIATALTGPYLQNELRKRNIIAGRVFNLGMGYTTIAEYYLLLKKLAKENPKALEKSIILLQSDGGLLPTDNWNDNWVHPAFPTLVLPFLDKVSVQRAVSSTGLSAETKLFLLPAYYLALPGQLLQARSTVFSRGAEFSEFVIRKLEPTLVAPDLARAGGIRFDQISLKNSQESPSCNETEYKKISSNPKIWDRSIAKEIATLAREQNSRLVLVETPLVPKEQKCLALSSFIEAQSTFIEQIKLWSAIYIKIDQNFADNDFADEKHLRLSRADAYTLSVANSIVKEIQ